MSANEFRILRCRNCGTVVEVLIDKGGDFFCCDEPMEEFKANTSDAASEKHVPIIEKTAAGYRVKAGSTLHPMTAVHWIQWVELLADGYVLKKILAPEDKPEVEFVTQAGSVAARVFCNQHGLWKSQ